MTYYPPLGSYGVVATPGLAGAVIRWGTHSPVNHAVLYVGGGKLVEGRPGGAGYAWVLDYRNIIWNDQEPIADDVRARIVDRANAMVGTRYGWVDIEDNALEALGMRWSWLEHVARRSGTLDCSMLVTHAYAPDIVLGTGVVTPSDLEQRIARHAWAVS